MNRKRVAVFAVAVLTALLVQPMALSQAASTGHTGHAKKMGVLRQQLLMTSWVRLENPTGTKSNDLLPTYK